MLLQLSDLRCRSDLKGRYTLLDSDACRPRQEYTRLLATLLGRYDRHIAAAVQSGLRYRSAGDNKCDEKNP